ncbi:hypothetical protein NHJ6243_009881 [Beauveria neobassiana]
MKYSTLLLAGLANLAFAEPIRVSQNTPSQLKPGAGQEAFNVEKFCATKGAKKDACVESVKPCSGQTAPGDVNGFVRCIANRINPAFDVEEFCAAKGARMDACVQAARACSVQTAPGAVDDFKACVQKIIEPKAPKIASFDIEEFVPARVQRRTYV